MCLQHAPSSLIFFCMDVLLSVTILIELLLHFQGTCFQACWEDKDLSCYGFQRASYSSLGFI